VIAVATTEITGYSALMLGLNELWYKNYQRSSFHFFDDNNEWLQMDKVGHVMTAYYVGKAGMDVLKWGGVENKKALWYGGTLGFLFLTSIEVFDGFSAEWGASWGDAVSNVAGTALLIGQEYAWKEQRVLLKFSAHFTDYAQYRPSVLGSNYSERIMKDYNGQTYWLSANIYSFLKDESKFPRWLNVAVGYSGEAMLKGDQDVYYIIKEGENIGFQRYRQYFLSLDVDLTKIKTKSHFLRAVFGTFGFVKFPFPALEYNKNDGLKMRPFYF